MAVATAAAVAALYPGEDQPSSADANMLEPKLDSASDEMGLAKSCEEGMMVDDALKKPSSPSVEAEEPTEAQAPSGKSVPVLPHFRAPGQFRHGKRYRYLRVVQTFCKLLRCPCRRRRVWEDPTIVSKQTLPPHTPLQGASCSVNGQDLGAAAGTGKQLLLSGKWKFRLFTDVHQSMVGGVESSSFNDDAWDEVLLPSHWQLLGYEAPTYTNLAYPFAAFPCRRPRFSQNPAGVYRRRFHVHTPRLGEQFRLLFNGVSSAAHVWLDGELLGYFQDSGTPHELDVTSVLAKAPSPSCEHVLVVRVLKWCDGSYLEDQDTWWLSGIFRDVVLYSLPGPAIIEDFHIESEVEHPYGGSADAELSVHAALRGLPLQDESGDTPAMKVQVRCEVRDGDHGLVAKEICSAPGPAEGRWQSIFGKDAMVASARLHLRAPAKWSPERPTLYTIRLSLVLLKSPVQNGEGGKNTSDQKEEEQVLQQEEWRFGVRDVRIVDKQLLLNGSPVLVNGVNRVENHPDYGKAMPESIIRDDLTYLKRYNFNAIRCSHCPNAPVFYRLCDELGLLVLDEANVENHGFSMFGAMAALQCDPEWRTAYLSRIQAMFGRAKNHACVIGWSLGNESGTGPNTVACADWLRHVDPGRYIHYESGEHHGDATLIMGDGRHPLSDVVCPMYANPGQCVDLSHMEDRPVILCEYSHAMGNSNGGLHLFYEIFRSHEWPSCQGGFVWDFADQALRVPRVVQPQLLRDWWLSGRWGYGGDFGVDSGIGDKWFCCNGLSLPDRTPKPAMFECKYLMQSLQFTAEWIKGESVADVLVEQQEGSQAECLPALMIRWVANDSLGAAVGEGTSRWKVLDEPRHAFKTERIPNDGNGLWLQLYAELAEDMSYASKGHVIANETIEVVSPPIAHREDFVNPAAVPVEGMSGNQLDDDDKRLLQRMQERVCRGVDVPLRWNGLAASTSPTAGGGSSSSQPEVRISQPQPGRWDVVAVGCYRATVRHGSLVSLRTADDVELLTHHYGKPVDFCFWRLPTDNDRGGVEVFAPKDLQKYVPEASASRAAVWAKVGLDKATTTIKSDKVSWTRCNGNLVMAVIAEHGIPGQAPFFSISMTFTFRPTGVFLQAHVKNLSPESMQKVRSLPRVGMQLVLPAACSQISWLGRGPHECYPDRKASAHRNVYRSTVEDMHIPYVVPGECGGRADVQWVAAQDARGAGLLAQYFCDDAACNDVTYENGRCGARPAGTTGAQVCAKRFTPQTAAEVAHDFELPHGEDLPVVLHIDTAHCGVGGLGGDTTKVWDFHSCYDINPVTPEWSFAVMLVPLASSSSSTFPGGPQLDVRAPLVNVHKVAEDPPVPEDLREHEALYSPGGQPMLRACSSGTFSSAGRRQSPKKVRSLLGLGAIVLAMVLAGIRVDGSGGKHAHRQDSSMLVFRR